MAQDTLQRISAGSMAKGVDVNRSDMSPVLQLDPASYNLTMGINEGLGPRQGLSPIPGHNDNEAPAAGHLPGLQRYEAGFGSTINSVRVGFFGFVPLRLGGVGASLPTISTYYAALISYTSGSYNGILFDSLLTSTIPTSEEQSSNIYEGLPATGPNNVATNVFALNLELIDSGLKALTSFGTLRTAKRNALAGLQTFATGKPYVTAAPFAVSGIDVPTKWLVGGATATGDATHAPSINLTIFTYLIGATSGNIGAGYPSQFNYQNYTPKVRQANVFTLKSANWNVIDYQLSYLPTSAIYLPVYVQDNAGTATIDYSTITATKTGAGVGYGNTDGALVNEEELSTNSAHQGVLVAAGKPLCILYQDWWRSQNGSMAQYVDLAGMPSEPSTVGSYSQDGANTPCCFVGFPLFVRGTKMVNTAGNPQLMGANTGILRKNTVYEFSFSVYNKRLNFESNVSSSPVKIQTGDTDDFIGLNLFTPWDPGTGTIYTQGARSPSGNDLVPYPGIFSVGAVSASVNPFHINYLEYRFYYRQEGMVEWLPALFIDAAKYWFYPHFAPLAACTGGIGGLLGGRAAGFQDYSKLPQDTYSCVVFYRNRAFWLSDKALVFSLVNNIYAYAKRNSAAAPAGSFRGAIIQAFPGQSDQDSRLVVFSTKGSFRGRFTGVLQQAVVQISVDTDANFDLDGSDFVLETWSDATAFSHRAACLAEGVLYFWGPKGIFRSDGVELPTRISQRWEPDIRTYYDPARTDEIHCLYNDGTKEIFWFFPPKVADGYPTHALVFSTTTEEFLPAKFGFQIDSAADLNIETGIGVAGARAVVSARATSASTIQRAYFFDERNRAGDYYPTGEMMVKTVASPGAANIRRLTLAAGYDPTNFATIIAGDHLTLQQVSDYAGAGLATPSDMIAVINAINHGAGTVDIILPTGATLDAAASLAHQQYFPLWHRTPTAKGLNGIPWQILTKYWVPNGPNFWAYWLYLYWQAKIRLLPSSFDQTIDLQYRTPVSDVGYLAAEQLTLRNNSDGNWQLYHPFKPGDQNFEGQGLKLLVSGIHIGSEWVIQYLEAHATQLEGDQLKIFEG